jgi:hypothetical protein
MSEDSKGDFSMVVRVSLAIATLSAKTSDSRELARAAIAAMRKPTDKMIEAAMKPYLHGNDDLMNAAFRETIHKYWHAMIDEALK